jgi:uncharacterized membrane protein YkoI
MKNRKIHYTIFVIIGFCCLVALYMRKGCHRIQPLPARDTSGPLTENDIISQERALEIARSAIKGRMEYDKTGEIVVELKENQYIVTFPHGIPKTPGLRAPDYAARVWIDAKSGKVLKVWGAS